MFEYENEKPPIKLLTENTACYCLNLTSMVIPSFIVIRTVTLYLYLKNKNSMWFEYFKKYVVSDPTIKVR